MQIFAPTLKHPGKRKQKFPVFICLLFHWISFVQQSLGWKIGRTRKQMKIGWGSHSPLNMTERHFIAPHFSAVCGICWTKNPVITLLYVILDLSQRFLQHLLQKPRKTSEMTLSSMSKVEQFLALLMLKAVSFMRLEPKNENKWENLSLHVKYCRSFISQHNHFLPKLYMINF